MSQKKPVQLFVKNTNEKIIKEQFANAEDNYFVHVSSISCLLGIRYHDYFFARAHCSTLKAE